MYLQQIDLQITKNEVDEWHGNPKCLSSSSVLALHACLGVPYFAGSLLGALFLALLGAILASLSHDAGWSMETGVSCGTAIGALVGFYLGEFCVCLEVLALICIYIVHAMARNSFGWVFITRRAVAMLVYLLIFFAPLNALFLYALAGQEICESADVCIGIYLHFI